MPRVQVHNTRGDVLGQAQLRPRQQQPGEGSHALRAVASVDMRLPQRDVHMRPLESAVREGGSARILQQELRRRAEECRPVAVITSISKAVTTTQRAYQYMPFFSI